MGGLMHETHEACRALVWLDASSMQAHNRKTYSFVVSVCDLHHELATCMEAYGALHGDDCMMK